MSREPSFESDTLKAEVLFDEFQFLGERDLLVIDGLHEEPQELANLLKHPSRHSRIALDVLRNGVQRVEQEMWVQLSSQRAQLRLRQQPLSIGFPNGLVLERSLVLE